MSQSKSDECFLLHQRSYGETSLIADVFTKNNGKMSLIAKGAKKPKSKFFGYLVPFNKLNISYSGRSELKTLTSIDRNLAKSGNTLTKTTYSLLYINELLIKLLPKDAKQEDLFDLYEIFINKVSSNADLEITLRHFELDLLDMLGYGFDYNADIDKNDSIEPNQGYSFVAEKGFRKSDRSDFLGKDIINIKNRELDKVSKKYLKQITTKAISTCMDGKDLTSRKIFKTIKQ
ncbi:MAG: DNA repair protein RecO [Gammaproteobacteria bacterium]|nr:DNA repair protein RecO [Gammaproteobacteria bacterium]|tara:strand:+ start:467 stop:1162 length:696 start_codon:yes stop_codon:yes gene_type:complete